MYTFQRLFAAAEIAKFSKEEQQLYEDSLKYYRDLKNVVDTAFEDGETKGRLEGKIEGEIEIAKEMKARGMKFEMIAAITGLSMDEIDQL